MMGSISESNDEELDLEKYRKIHESDSHWALRKNFMKTHWNNFNEDEILCLAQVFINMEFLGCRYPAETMQRVAELAKSLPEIQKYKRLKAGRLKRTFVGGSDCSKAKFQKTDAPRNLDHGLKEIVSSSQEPQGKLKQSIKPVTDGMTLNDERVNYQPIIKFNQKQKFENLRELLKDVIFFDTGDVEDTNGSLSRTVSMMSQTGKLQTTYDAGSKTHHYIYDGQIIGEGTGESRKDAKKLADIDLIKTLKDNCYTIKTKLKYYSAEDVIQKSVQNDYKQAAVDSDKLQENNVGFKMLKMLGWKGGSLGPKNNGIIDPVNLEIKIGRLGLGSTDVESFDIKYFRNLLQNFKNSQLEYDLVFSADFTKEERAQIHQ